MTARSGYQASFVQADRRSLLSLALLFALAFSCFACSHRQKEPATENALAQHTGAAGSTIPNARPPFYPNTAGNIVAPPGNPAGNSPGSPPIVGGNTAQQSVWP